MTLPCAARALCDADHHQSTTAWPHSLVAILLLAASIRLPLAFWPNLHHPDKIFQYLEPAWRMLGHEGVYSWEWRYGIRGFLLPTLMARPGPSRSVTGLIGLHGGAGLSRADS
jgi:hypothetical protein